MTNLAFPSEEFPAQPAVTLQIPQNWEPVHALGVVMATRRAADDGTFVPNVVVRIERRPVDFEVTDALAELNQFAAERPAGTTSEPSEAELDGRLFVGCDLSWVDDQVGTVLQTHLFGVVPSGPFVQLVQVTGSVGGAQSGRDYPIVTTIMRSLTVALP
ncbi:MAG: hypothetical protein ACYDDU_00830 [Dermatophilaceae bacterium]